MLRAALMGMCMTLSLPAWAIYKCEADGKVTYSEAPCPSGKETRLASPPESEDASQTRDRLDRQKKELDRLTQARHQREAQQEKQHKRGSAASEARCRKLALHKARTESDTTGRTRLDIEAVRKRAQQAAEKYEMECGK